MSQSLLKIEEICQSCGTHFILAINEDDLEKLSCCPFCTNPMELDMEEVEE
jgi:hypothetical protein